MTNVRVKICGITNLDDARVAVQAGADMLGFILYPKSPRYVEPERVREIVDFAKRERLKTKDSVPNPFDAAQSKHHSPIFPLSCVGVFVNEPAPRVLEILDFTSLDYAQLHGDEAPEEFAALAGRAFKALRPRDHDEGVRDAARFAPLAADDVDGNGPRLMIDAYDPNAYGGTGQRADWPTARAMAQNYARLLLAGGLTTENVAEAVRMVQPWGVDVGSGVEVEPGRKNHEKVRAFVRAAKL